MKNFVVAVQLSTSGPIEQYKIQEETLQSAYLKSVLKYFWNNETELQELCEEVVRIQEEFECGFVEAVKQHAFNMDCMISILELE